MAVLLGVAFLAGLVTALSPCVLPVLPILLAGGATGGRRRLRQLPAHPAVPEAVGRVVPRSGPDDRGRPRSGVRVRARPGERPGCRPRPRRPVPGRSRQRLLDLAGVREPVLAGEVRDRQARPPALRALRRGRVRADRARDPAAARGGRPTCPRGRDRLRPASDRVRPDDAGDLPRLPAARPLRRLAAAPGPRRRVRVPHRAAPAGPARPRGALARRGRACRRGRRRAPPAPLRRPRGQPRTGR